LGITYKDERPAPPEALGRAYAERLLPRGLELIVEPGRVIVGNAGVLDSDFPAPNGSEAQHTADFHEVRADFMAGTMQALDALNGHAVTTDPGDPGPHCIQ